MSDGGLREAFFAKVSDLLVVGDFSGRIVDVSDSWTRTLGWSREELLGMSYYSLFHPEEQQRNLTGMAETAASGELVDYVMRMRHKDGSYRWISACSTVDPATGLIYGVGRDVTKTYHVSREFAEIRETFKLALHSGRMGLWEYDVLRNRLLWDESQHELYGLGEGAAPKTLQEWFRVVHPEDRERVEASVDQAMLPGTNYQARFRVVRPDGQIRHLCSNSFKMLGPAGELLRVVGVNWDVTEEMEREAELSRRQALSHHSAQLAALGEMAGSIAHEINNPLFIIRAQAERLEAGATQGTLPAAVVAETAARIQATVDRISTIVRGLKNMVRDGESDPWVVQELARVVSECLEPYAHRLRREGIKLRLDLDPAVRVRCRPVQVSQILLNLLNNSIDALRSRERKEIDIVVSQSDGRAVLLFADTGPGVPLELRERIFSAFFTTKEPGAGTGLGLSISAALAVSHGGSLRIAGPDGEGAHFELTLPLWQEEENASHA